ncbi:MAG TPA: T9SS type A sorting domain-containing protein [Ferruginibacter sp.]|nr:T9SS type A sorting domain-containing protein [Ferruginibacter sp.]
MKNQLFSPGGIRSIILFFLLLFLSAASFAATYYISPTGNDVTGNGTISNPWKTLRKATQTVTASGNIIHVNAGTYIETQTSFLAPGVNIEGAGNTNTIIKAGMTGQFSTLLSLDSPNGINGAQSVSQLTFDGQYVNEIIYVTSIGIFVTGRSNVLIHDCRIINFRNRGVIFDGNDANDPVTDPGNYATGNKFYNNTVLNSAENNGSFGTGLLNIGSQMGMEIYSNTMIQDQRPDFKNGWPIKPWNNGWLKGVKIYNNTLTKASYKGSFPGQNGDWDFCLEFINVEGLEIYGNTIQGSVDLNFSRKGAYAYSAWIHHNNIGRSPANPNFENGILLEFRTESVLIEHNIINNVSTGIQFNTRTVNQDGGFPNPGGTPPGGYSYLLNNTIRNNLISNLYVGDGSGGAGGIVITSESGNDEQINGLHIYNNTIVAKAGDAPAVGLNFSNQENGNATNVNVRNNIVIGFTYTWLAGSQPNPAMSNVTVTHNDAFGNGFGNTPHWPGGNPASYTYNNNLSVDPRFVSSTNFHLHPTSPVIDRGIDVGLPYYGNAPDMGYAEFNPGGPVPIKLVEFNVRGNAGKNLLQWKTATESNSDHFNIERSNDAQTWYTIGRVNASGFSTTEIKYDFTDATPVNGMNYYRLAMTDKNATVEYSRIVSISSGADNNTDISYVDLSSTTGTAILRITSAWAQAAGLSVIDISGRTVYNSNIYLQQGNNTISKNIPALLPAIYYVRLFTKDGVVVKKAFSRN